MSEHKPPSELFEEMRFYIDRALKADIPLPAYALAMATLQRIEEQKEAADRALADAVWDGQRQGFQAVREAISGRIAAPLVDEIMEDAEIILRASNPAKRPT